MKTHRLIFSVAILGMGLTAEAQVPARPVAAEQRHSGRIVRSFTEPFEKSVAASAVTGIVLDVNVREGDIVSVGDPLASLNRRVIEASLEIATARAESTARVDAAKSQFELVKTQLESLQALKASGHTNRYELEQKQSEYDTTYSEYQAAQDDQTLAKLEVKRIQAELDDRTIRSPIAGYVTEIHKQRGENLSNNEPQYATIVSLEKLRIRFYVGAGLLKESNVGGSVVVEVGTERKQLPGTIEYVSPIIDSDSGVGRMEVVIDNESLSVQSGVVAYLNQSTNIDLARRTPTRKRIAVHKVSARRTRPFHDDVKNIELNVTPLTGNGPGQARLKYAPPACRPISRSPSRVTSRHSANVKTSRSAKAGSN